jgi:myo-inositol-1-phosphate synthase
MLATEFTVDSPNVKYTADSITAEYVYRNAEARVENNKVKISPKETKYTFKTDAKVPKLGVMLVGLGGNNGSTVVGGAIANREGISWRTKNGIEVPNYYGSITQSSTVYLGTDPSSGEVTTICFFRKI